MPGIFCVRLPLRLFGEGGVLVFFVFEVLPRGLCHHARKAQEGNEVGNGHHAV